MTAARAASSEAPRVLIIGVGNPARGDDGVGPVTARALSARRLPRTTVVESSGEGLELNRLWRGAERVFLIDAIRSGAPPGTVRRIDARATSLPAGAFRSSSHTFGVAEGVELARALNQLPPMLILYGIEGRRFDYGFGLSPGVAGAARRVVTRILRDLGRRI